MKYIVALQNKADMLKAKALGMVAKKEGQTTIEYVMIIGVIVVVAGLAMVAMRSLVPDVFESIKAKILGGINNAN
ncbi:MAG: hypothetical protein J6Y25_02015 [Elusimicrobiaceae bacterium]|nr:hypothetical protein [Elusimicrobiaceae bacterium]MBP5616507.1 hypothetical protein [Elusimicrobiaceae bacterium]